MHGGTFRAWAGNVPPLADTKSNGKGPEDQNAQGRASAAIYRETLNDTTQSKINAFANRAAAALNCRKSDLIIQDPHRRTVLGQSVENGTNVGQSQPYLR